MRILRRGHRHLKPETLSEYLDGRLSSIVASRVEEEAANCPDCKEELDSLRFTVRSLRSVVQTVPQREFTLTVPPLEVQGRGLARPITPFRMPAWAYVGAAAAAVLVVALLLSGELSGLVSPGSRPVQEQASSAVPATAMANAASGGQMGETDADTERARVPVTSAPMAMAESAPAPEERRMEMAAPPDPKPQTGPTPASVAAAGAGKPQTGRVESAPRATPTHIVAATTVESPQPEPPIMATVPPSPTGAPATAIPQMAMAAVQEAPSTVTVVEGGMAKEVVKETHRSPSPGTPRSADSKAARTRDHADAQTSTSALAPDTREVTAMQETTPTPEIPDPSPSVPSPPLSQVATTLPVQTPTVVPVEKPATRESTPTVAAIPGTGTTKEGISPKRPDPTAGPTHQTPAMTGQALIPTRGLVAGTTLKSEPVVDGEDTPEPVSRDTSDTLVPGGAFRPILMGLGAALATTLMAAIVIIAILSRRRNR